MIRRAALVLLAVSFQASALCAYVPPACTGLPVFIDVPNAHALCPWMVELLHEGITGGCNPSQGTFCPDDPVTRAQASLLIGKALHEHLWGQGRPNTNVYGFSASQLCASLNAPGVFMGLSRLIVPWEGSAAACPAGFWVCTRFERGSTVCDTIRPDNSCDIMGCSNDCADIAANSHAGWLADEEFQADTFHSTLGWFMLESGGAVTPADICYRFPVWCCTGG